LPAAPALDIEARAAHVLLPVLALEVKAKAAQLLLLRLERAY